MAMEIESAEAAVIINEVAWMGSTASPNHEWIELYNNGAEAFDVSEWTLTDGNNLTIVLAGTIPAGAHVVLERSSDDTAPGAAFLVYTGALVNTGATLTLRRSDGQIEDQVVGGENWQHIGGDNTTKATAQYNGVRWVTAVATPGAALSADAEVFDGGKPAASPTTSSGSNTERTSISRSQRSAAVPLVPATTVLALGIEGQSTAYVNQQVTFTAKPSGISDTIMHSLQYSWNFGDATTASGSKARHTYRYPGTYIVSLRGQFARHNTVTRHEITVLPVTFSIARTPTGEIQIHNNAVYDIDVSGFTVRMADELITFPPDSLIVAKQTVTLNPRKFSVGTVGSGAVLLADAAGVVVAEDPPRNASQTFTLAASVQSTPRPAAATQVAPVFGVSQVAAAEAEPSPRSGFGFSEAQGEAAPGSLDGEVVVRSAEHSQEATPSAPSSVVEDGEKRNEPRWPYAALAFILLVTVGGVMFMHRGDNNSSPPHS